MEQITQFSIETKLLIDALKVVGSIIENTQVIPILSYVKLEVAPGQLIVTASNSEIEITSTIPLAEHHAPFTAAVSCQKLLDICRTFAGSDIINITLLDDWLHVKSLQATFTLATLPVDNFIKISMPETANSWQISSKLLQKIISNTAFAIAEQDVRFFLNGLHIGTDNGFVYAAATDGHRVATAEAKADINYEQQCILPRKTAISLAKLLYGLEEVLSIEQTDNHIKISCPQFTMISNLLEGSKLDCQSIMPDITEAITVEISSKTFKQALSRAAILSHAKFRSARVTLADNCMQIVANNAAQERIQENIAIDFSHETLETYININYLQDLLNSLSTDLLTWYFCPNEGNLLIEEQLSDSKFTYAVMSMQV